VTKRVYTALAVLLVAIAGVIAWQVLRPQEREPVYQGKRLAFWLYAAYSGHGRNGEGAEEAVRQAGTNAIPTLLRMLRAKDSALRVKATELARRQHLIDIEFTHAEGWNDAAVMGFHLLGSKAQSAVPALIEIANQNISSPSRNDAICALGMVGPSAKDALPSLLQWTTNADWKARLYSIGSLYEIGAEPDRVMPVLMSALHDPNQMVQSKAVWALGEYGPKAKIAVPALVESWNSSNGFPVRSELVRAVEKIDPEAAATNAAIKTWRKAERGARFGLRRAGAGADQREDGDHSGSPR
jgi:HEAT repeat protein